MIDFILLSVEFMVKPYTFVAYIEQTLGNSLYYYHSSELIIYKKLYVICVKFGWSAPSILSLGQLRHQQNI
jgi:hypothetical protein